MSASSLTFRVSRSSVIGSAFSVRLVVPTRKMPSLLHAPQAKEEGDAVRRRPFGLTKSGLLVDRSSARNADVGRAIRVQVRRLLPVRRWPIFDQWIVSIDH